MNLVFARSESTEEVVHKTLLAAGAKKSANPGTPKSAPTQWYRHGHWIYSTAVAVVPSQTENGREVVAVSLVEGSIVPHVASILLFAAVIFSSLRSHALFPALLLCAIILPSWLLRLLGRRSRAKLAGLLVAALGPSLQDVPVGVRRAQKISLSLSAVWGMAIAFLGANILGYGHQRSSADLAVAGVALCAVSLGIAASLWRARAPRIAARDDWSDPLLFAGTSVAVIAVLIGFSGRGPA